MNIDQIKKAYENGATIEARLESTWFSFSKSSIPIRAWDFEGIEYRIKTHTVPVSPEVLELCAVKAEHASDLTYHDVVSLMNWCDWQSSDLWEDMSLQEILNVYRATAKYDTFEDWVQEDIKAAHDAFVRLGDQIHRDGFKTDSEAMAIYHMAIVTMAGITASQIVAVYGPTVGRAFLDRVSRDVAAAVID